MVMTAGSELRAEEIPRAQLVRMLFFSARDYRKPRVDWWRRAYRLVHNRIWAPSRDPWMPSPSASEIFPIVAALVGWMTDQRPMLYLTPAADPGARLFEILSQIAHDLEHTLEANWANRDTEAEHEKMIWDAHLYGTGILKTLWDASLEEGLGDVKTVRVDPFAFYVDPQATSLETANYIIEANTMSLQELDRRYPGAADQILHSMEESSALDQKPDIYSVGRPPMANPGGLNGNAPRYGLPGGGRISVGQRYDMGVTVYEAWIREHDLWVDTTDPEHPKDHVDDRWRCVVVAGNRVLMDEPAEALFGHGRHPYTRYVMSETGDFWGVSLVDHLAPLQIHLNRLLAVWQNHSELTGNPVFVEDQRANITRQKIVNKPGQRLMKGTGADAGWLQPPPISQDVQLLAQFYLHEMERVSGLSAIVRGMTPTGRNAQGVLDSVQEAAFVRVRLALRNLERALRTSGRLTAQLICENYTQPRIVSITGQQDMTPIILRSRHFYVPDESGQLMPLKFSLAMQAGASMPTSRQARAQEADMLYAMGGIDRQALLEAHDYPNRAQIIERIAKQMATGAWNPPGQRQRAR